MYPSSRSSIVPDLRDAGGDSPAAITSSPVVPPTRPYQQRISGVSRTTSPLVVGPPKAPLASSEVLSRTMAPPASIPPERLSSKATLRVSPLPRAMPDPWDHAHVSATSLQEQLTVVCSALHATLGILAHQLPDDPALEEARRKVAALEMRHTVHQARDHEVSERWLHASIAWMRAADLSPQDAWLPAHAARTLLLTNASVQDAAQLARRSLAIDPNNPLAAVVLDRIGH
jgi:hypothetical protein